MTKLQVGQLVSEQRPQARSIGPTQGTLGEDGLDAARRMRRHGHADGVRIEQAIEGGASTDGALPQSGRDQQGLEDLGEAVTLGRREIPRLDRSRGRSASAQDHKQHAEQEVPRPHGDHRSSAPR
jgi:hypothetical protein